MLVFSVKLAGHLLKHHYSSVAEKKYEYDDMLSAVSEMLVKSIVSYCAVRQADGPAGGGFVVDAQATLAAMTAPDNLLRGVVRAIFEHNPFGMADNLRAYLQREDLGEIRQYCDALNALRSQVMRPVEARGTLALR